jgi:hypothetical protein
MISCRYVGNDSSMIGDREFDVIGQRAVFSEQGYREAVLGGAAFIPEEDFKKLDLTQSELDEFGPVGSRVDPTNSFCVKTIRGQQIFREIRDRMLLGESQSVLAEAADGPCDVELVTV